MMRFQERTLAIVLRTVRTIRIIIIEALMLV
jgi:hypothetical protein